MNLEAHFHRLRRRVANDLRRLALGAGRNAEAKANYVKNKEQTGNVQGHGGDNVAVNGRSRPKLSVMAFPKAAIYVIAATRRAPYETATFSVA
jgi:hypothetical protein